MWKVAWVLHWTSYLLVTITLFGIFILVCLHNATPLEYFDRLNRFYKEKINPDLRIVYNGSVYKIEERYLIKWKHTDSSAYGRDRLFYEKDVALNEYNTLKEQRTLNTKPFKRIIIPSETKLGKVLYG
jgi:hypothetical protein